MMQRKVGNTLETYRQDEHGHLLEIVHSSWGLFTVETRDDRVHRKLKGFVEGHLALADLKPFMKYSRWFRGPHMDWNDLLYEGYLAQSNDTELEDDTALSAYFHECWKRSDYWETDAEFILDYLVEQLRRRLPAWGRVSWIQDRRTASPYLQLDEGYTLAMLERLLQGHHRPIDA